MQPHGTVAFADLPALPDVNAGWMYNISDEFTTTDDFKEGSGNAVPAGANIYKTSDGKWDVLAGTPVTGVKGAKETSYRRGNVNLTPENIGAVATGGDTASNVTSFTSSDVADGSAPSWTNVATLTSGETHTSLFAKVSQMFKNVRYLYKMFGTTDISSIGGGTVTGAISSQNKALAQTVFYVNSNKEHTPASIVAISRPIAYTNGVAELDISSFKITPIIVLSVNVLGSEITHGALAKTINNGTALRSVLNNTEYNGTLITVFTVMCSMPDV